MISEASLAACRRFSYALASNDLDAALAEAHPEIELCTPRGVLRGAAGVRTLLMGTRLEHLEPTVIVEDVIADGPRAVAIARIELRWRETDELADRQRVAALLDVRDERIIRWQPTVDVESALEPLTDDDHDPPMP